MAWLIRIEVRFPQKEEVTVFHESAIAEPEKEPYFETFLFTFYAARQIANLRGKAWSLSQMLATIDEAEPLLDVESRLGGVRIDPASSRGGGKGFGAELSQRTFFKLHTHGFELHGRGLGYYGPTSTLALLYWLLRRRENDAPFQDVLGKAARLMGSAGSQHLVTTKSQAFVAVRAAREAWGFSLLEASAAPFEAGPDEADMDAVEIADAEARGINFSALVRSAVRRLDAAVEEIQRGQGKVDRETVRLRIIHHVCGLEILAAAHLEDENASRAFAELLTAFAIGEEAKVGAANSRATDELVSVLRDHGLGRLVLPLANALDARP